VTSANCNQFLLIDITALAQGWITVRFRITVWALALTSAAGTFFFDSKESLFTGNARNWKSCSARRALLGRRDHKGFRGHKASGQRGHAGH